jgi:hypothetical protein
MKHPVHDIIPVNNNPVNNINRILQYTISFQDSTSDAFSSTRHHSSTQHSCTRYQMHSPVHNIKLILQYTTSFQYTTFYYTTFQNMTFQNTISNAFSSTRHHSSTQHSSTQHSTQSPLYDIKCIESSNYD